MVATKATPIRVLLIDDHACVRAGYRLLLETRSTIKVVAEAGTSDEALTIALSEEFDISLLDLQLGNKSPESGLDIIPKLLKACPTARILALTDLTDYTMHQEAARRGAMGLVSKDDSVSVLLKAVEKVYAGEPWFDRTLLGSLLSERSGVNSERDAERAKINLLTKREHEIVRLIAKGLKNREIGQHLNPSIGEKTIRNHLSAIFGKLEVVSRFELLIYAYRHGLAAPPVRMKH